MAKILTPDDLAGLFQDIYRRLDILDTQPARALEVRDSAGILRVKAGQVSTGHFGLILYDSAGVRRLVADDTTNGITVFASDGATIIWDSTGLQQVASIAAQITQASQTFTMINDTAFHDVPNSSTGNFSIARNTTLEAMGMLLSTNAAGAFFSDVRYRLVVKDGGGSVLNSAVEGAAGTANSYYTQTGYILNLYSAGTYSVCWQYAQGNAYSNTQSVTVKSLVSSAIKFGG